ncbi:MAG: cupredoxin domain-containing protein [Chloroflexi bacterium]|jgi:plastocyanin|nr:cupredoxin domain-containing protein [Chloroflexota bacterium]
MPQRKDVSTTGPSGRGYARRIAAALLGGLLLAGCGGRVAERNGARVQAIAITSAEFAFAPAQVRVRANVPVQLTLDNRGLLTHDLTIDRVGGPGWLAGLVGHRVHVEAGPGSRAIATFTPTPGAYLFYCAQDRHAIDGMVGILIAAD